MHVQTFNKARKILVSNVSKFFLGIAISYLFAEALSALQSTELLVFMGAVLCGALVGRRMMGSAHKFV